MRARLLRILIALDVLAFALLTLGGSKRNETISAAAYSLELDGKWQGKVARPIIDYLMRPIERAHCRVSYLAEQAPTRKGPTP
jgi:hypothetical protein